MSTDRNSLSGTDAPGAADWRAAALAQIRRVEAAPLPANIGALLDGAAADTPDRIARALQGMGVRRGGKVAVMLPNVAEMPITWLALAQLGAVMVPVNTRSTAHELRYVLDDSGATHLVLHGEFLGVLDAVPAPRPPLRGAA